MAFLKTYNGLVYRILGTDDTSEHYTCSDVGRRNAVIVSFDSVMITDDSLEVVKNHLKEYKVYHGQARQTGKIVTFIIAAKSKDEATVLCGLKYAPDVSCWHETPKLDQCKFALANLEKPCTTKRIDDKRVLCLY